MDTVVVVSVTGAASEEVAAGWALTVVPVGLAAIAVEATATTAATATTSSDAQTGWSLKSI